MSLPRLITSLTSLFVYATISTMTATADGFQVGEQVDQKVAEVSESINQSETAQEISAGILTPIYEAAEYISFPGFYWLGFMLMVAGIVSFLGQLVLGKLVVLSQMHFSLTEILSDTLGLAISAIGLVLTTQAATENSTFTQSPAMILSATGVGAVLGIIFYFQGQSQELRAARAAKLEKKNKKSVA